MRARARSFRAAWNGIAHAFRTQPNFRIETWIGVAALALAVWLDAPLAPILLASALVLVAEMVNTAVEATVDLASPDPHDSARTAKDCAAGAVLIAAFLSVGVGLATLGPPLFERIFRGAL